MNRLLRFVESQENYDFVVTRLGAVVTAITAVTALIFIVAIIAK